MSLACELAIRFAEAPWKALQVKEDMLQSRDRYPLVKICTVAGCSYFASRFPNLLMTTYAFGLQHCAEEPMFAKYYPPESQETPMALDIIAGRLPQGSLLPVTSGAQQQPLVRAPLPLGQPLDRHACRLSLCLGTLRRSSDKIGDEKPLKPAWCNAVLAAGLCRSGGSGPVAACWSHGGCVVPCRSQRTGRARRRCRGRCSWRL